ncbi:MAG: phenylacetate--CoA ligase family protein [Desulfovibrionales bacterium]|nr:MAG: phenylacetate--CoA ligase family protein [Desulfovibrionales bacterium]
MDDARRRSGIYHDLEQEPEEKRRERKWQVAVKLAHEAWDTAPALKVRMESAGLKPDDLRSPEDWSRIPVLRKKQLIDLQRSGPRLGGLLTTELGDLQRLYFSPGPIADPEGRGKDFWGWTEAFYAAGFRQSDLVQMTFGYHLTPAGLMLEEPLRELGCAVIPAGPGNTMQQVEIMTSWPVTGFVGMASFLKIIRDKAEVQGMNPKTDFQLRTAFVAAERLTETVRRDLESSLDMLVRQGYGTADLGCIAYECPALGGMHLSSRCLVEICDPKTGEPLPAGDVGEVVVTPFNPVYPLVRFATGDLSRLVTEPCACGRTAPKLAGILGRADDTAKVKGQFIYPHQVSQVLTRFPQVARWQVVVSNPKGKDRLELHLELRENAGHSPEAALDTARLQVVFQESLKLRPEVTVLAQGQGLPEGAPALVDQRTYEDGP